MILKRVLLCALVVLLLSGISYAEELVKDQVSCYTTWDDTYFYLAFKVDSPDVQATHTQPNSDLAGDDSIEFYLETDNKHSMKITPECFSMGVSAAGGSHFQSGNDAGELKLAPVYSYKYGATVQGTINNPDDIDMGYNIEMAVPWTLLKTNGPGLGDMMSFNVIIRRHTDKGVSFISLSPKVKAEEDILDPAKWSNLVFAAHTFGVATTSYDKILSAKYVVRSPLIDGLINDKEWHQNTSFTVDLPMPAGFVYEAKFPVQRAVLAKYLYWYQGDTRKAAPATPFKLADTPVKGIGPWFSYDRVQWHKEQLEKMASVGVSVVLPDYLGAGAGADKGLDCLVAALTEMRNEGKSYPMIGMYLDASALRISGSPQAALYGKIKSFFDRIPAPFRAYASGAKPYAGAQAAIVFIGNGKSVPGFSPAIVGQCTQSFLKDFGCPIVWVGDKSLADNPLGMDAVVGATGTRISIAGVTTDDSCAAGWADAIAANPLWVYCDAWNDFASGKCMCETWKLGTRRLDMTRDSIKKFLVSRDYSAQYLRFDIPRVIAPKELAQAEVTVRNVGGSTWRSLDGYALGYRWYRSGRYFGESKIRIPISRDVPPGDTITLPLGIATVTAAGTAMPEGNCELRIEMIRLKDNRWFSALGDVPLMAPVAIGPSADWAASCISCDVPNMVGATSVYAASARVRNDGTQSWRGGVVRLNCKIATASGELVKEMVVPLAKECKPGTVAEFSWAFTAMPTGKAAKSVKFDNPAGYKVSLSLLGGDKTKPVEQTLLSQVLDVYDSDYAVRFVDADVPDMLTPGQSLTPKVVLRNCGTLPWDGKKVKIGYHWFNQDGSEAVWDGGAVGLKTNIMPGWPVVVTAAVQAPNREGKFTLVWDLMVDGKWLSPGPISRGGDILPKLIDVTNMVIPAGDSASAADVKK